MSGKDSSSMLIATESIQDKIYKIRDLQVMLDSDLARLYQVETGALNRQVKRNIERFPEDFCFQLSPDEYDNLKCQVGISSIEKHGGRRTPPWVFTEQGIAMLSSVIHTDVSISANISIMRSFVRMRHIMSDNSLVFQRLERVEIKQLEFDSNLRIIFDKLETPKTDKAFLFFKGQMWDATSCLEDIIQKAESSIVLIDNYVDKGTLDLLSKKGKHIPVCILTSEKGSSLSEREITAFRSQYGSLIIKHTGDFHDRFLILDKSKLYYIGASIKDAGKKTFAVCQNEDPKILELLLERI